MQPARKQTREADVSMIAITVAIATAALSQKEPATVLRSLQSLFVIGHIRPQPQEVGAALNLSIMEDSRWLNQPLAHRDSSWKFTDSKASFSEIDILREPDDGNGHFGEQITVKWQRSHCVDLQQARLVLHAKATNPTYSVYHEPARSHFLIEKRAESSDGMSTVLQMEGASANSCVSEASVSIDGPALR